MNDPYANPNNDSFKLVWCDGPDLSQAPKAAMDSWTASTGRQPSSYTPCNFTGALGQVQHLINIAIVLGIIAAFAGIVYAGYIYVSVSVTGKTADLDKAKVIFKKILIGLLVILCAWFIVYQIIAWLTSGSSPATALLNH